MNFGCTIPMSGPLADPVRLRDLAVMVEELGYDSIWVSDHVVVPAEISSAYPYSVDGKFVQQPTSPFYEPLTVLSYLAGCTRRVRLGTHVLILPYRNPVVTAKIVSSLDNLSGGRVDLGIGVGGMREEFEALGYSYFERRGAVTDEQIKLMKAMWTEAVPSFDGEFYHFKPIGPLPHPHQKPHPPIWVGGHTKPAIRRTARLGDGWLPIGARPPADLPPNEIAAARELLDAEARRIGRDPASIPTCFSTTINLSDKASSGDRRPFQGNPDEIASDLAAYRAVGVTRFVFGFPATRLDDFVRRLRQFADKLGPVLRST